MTKDSNIKLRVCKLAHYFSNSVREFERNVGLTRGSLGNLKPNQSISSEILSQITDKFPEINLYWLISGEGEMLRQENEKELHYVNTTPTVNEPPINYGSKKCDLCKEKDNQIEDLKERILSQEQTIRALLSKIPDD